MQAGVVEPPDPFQGGEFNLLDGAPWLAGFDQLGLEQPVDGFRQSVVIAVADRSGRCLDTQVREAFGIAQR